MKTIVLRHSATELLSGKLSFLTGCCCLLLVLFYSIWRRSFVFLGPGSGGGDSGSVTGSVSVYTRILLPLGSANEVCQCITLSNVSFIEVCSEKCLYFFTVLKLQSIFNLYLIV